MGKHHIESARRSTPSFAGRVKARIISILSLFSTHLLVSSILGTLHSYDLIVDRLSHLVNLLNKFVEGLILVIFAPALLILLLPDMIN